MAIVRPSLFLVTTTIPAPQIPVTQPQEVVSIPRLTAMITTYVHKTLATNKTDHAFILR
jgi:hypothetical protein